MNLPTGVRGGFFYAFLILFVIASIINLISGFLEKEKVRKISKPFCLFFLSLAVILAVPHYPMLYIAALAGFIGDIILIWKDNKVCVGLGVVSFWIGHGLYIASMLQILYAGGAFASSPFAWAWMILYVVLLMMASVYPMSLITDHSKIFTTFGIFYSTILVSVGVSAIMGCALGFANYFYLVIIGDVFFIASDCILAYTIFIKDIKRRDFYIMLTYLLGQAFILSGLVLTLLK